MSQLSLSLDSSLLVRDAQGRYLLASADQILAAARQVIDLKNPRGTLFTSPALVKDYLRTKLASFEHEVFAAVPRQPASADRVRGTVPRHHRPGIGVSARGGEGGPAAQRGSGGLFAQSSERESRAEPGRQGPDPAPQGGPGAGGRAHAGSHRRGWRSHYVIRRMWPALTTGASAPFFCCAQRCNSGPRGPARAAHLPKAGLRGWWGGAVLLFPSSCHGVLAVKGCACKHAGGLRPSSTPDRLRCAVTPEVTGNSARQSSGVHHEQRTHH